MAQFVPFDQRLAGAVDQTANPPWCMVPLRGSKTVALTDDSGLTLKISSGAASIQFTETSGPSGRRIQINGLAPGDATLQAMRGQTLAASLDVSVLPRKEFKICVLFVYDKNGETTGRPLSKLSYTDLQNAIGTVNNILLPQANISARISGMGPTHVHDDLSQGLIYNGVGVTANELHSLPAPLHVQDRRSQSSGCVSGSPPGPEGCDSSGLGSVSNLDLRNRLLSINENYNLLRRADPGADFTFIVINKLAQAPDVGAYTDGDGCIFPETVPSFARGFVMAHEFCHFLLGRRPDHSAWHTSDARDLMYPKLAVYASDIGFLLRKPEVIQIAKKIPK